MERYEQVMIPELNSGQLALLIRAQYLLEVVSLPKLHGQPFSIGEIEAKIEDLLS